MKLINYSKLSKLLTGKEGNIRANYIPEKHRKAVELVKRWEKYMIEELKALKEK